MRFKIYFRKFHVLAVRMLNEFHNENKELTREMLTQDGAKKGASILEIAATVGNEEFIAHSSCQNLLSTKWGGDLKLEEDRRFKVNYLYLRSSLFFIFNFIPVDMLVRISGWQTYCVHRFERLIGL